MEKWTQAMLQQADDDRNRRKAVLPKTMEIRMNLSIENPMLFETYNGEVVGEVAVEVLKPDKIMKLTPTTTVREIKDSVLKHLPMLEYNRTEIQCEAEDLPDIFTVQQIANRFRNFVEDKLLNLHANFRNPTFMKMYKYFIDMGISQEIAKNQTNTITKFLRDKGIPNTLGTTEARAQMRAKSIMDIIKEQNMTDENKNEITNAIIDFYKNVYRPPTKKFSDYMNPFERKPTNNFATQVGTTKEEANPSTNDTVDAFQYKKAKIQTVPLHENSFDTSTGNEKTKQAKDMGLSGEPHVIDHELDRMKMMQEFKARTLARISVLMPLPDY